MQELGIKASEPASLPVCASDKVSFLISQRGMYTCPFHEVVLRLKRAKAPSESGGSVKADLMESFPIAVSWAEILSESG